MRFTVLGPLAVSDLTETVVLKPSKPTSLLAALLLRPDVSVGPDYLQTMVWDGAVPDAAKSTLQTYVMRLRKLFRDFGLAEEIILTTPLGYRLPADETSLDLVQFRRLVERAGAVADPTERLGLLRTALALWQVSPAESAPLSNVASDALHRDRVPRLVEEWLRATELRLDIELELGRYRDLPAELRAVTAAFPSHERFSEQLIEALYRGGRQREALAEYQRVRSMLRDELGIDPGAGLRRLELSILRGDPIAEPPAGPVSLTAAEPVALPPPVPHFVGRDEEMSALYVTLTASGPGPAIVVITGPPGIGKSALACRLAHTVLPDFDGNHAYYSLGTGSAGPDPTALPADRLVLIEDPGSIEEVLPLLPRTAGSAAIITCRDSLSRLSVLRGATILRLQPLPASDAQLLLSSVLGAHRVSTERAATGQLAELCGYFPVALMIAAARLRTGRDGSVSEFVEWLSSDPVRKLSLSLDPSMSLGQVVLGQLRRLPAELADAFVGFARHAPDGLDSRQAARLLELEEILAERVLEALVEANLLEVDCAGGYSMHALLRAVGVSFDISNGSARSRLAHAAGALASPTYSSSEGPR